MKAALFKAKQTVELADRPDPTVQEPTDVIVRVIRSCVCGSDLWFYRDINKKEGDTPTGHEFIGVVEETGEAVNSLQTGDFVIAPFLISDGSCAHCQAGNTANCAHGQSWAQNGNDGGQGERVRVPLADGTLFAIDHSRVTDELLPSLLTLSDVMCTGHHAAVCGNVQAGDTVAVIGDGAVGLCAVLAAKRLGAKRIIAMSRHKPRQNLAKEFGATDIIAERGDNAIKKVMELTDDIGVDAALECVGTDEAMQTAIGIARPGSVIGAVGVPNDIELPYKDMFFKNLGVRGGPAPARAYIPELLDDVLEAKIDPGKVFDLQVRLDEIAEAYAAMDERRAIKSLLTVSEL